MRLSQFLRQNTAPIITEWVAFAATLDTARTMSKLQLQNHVEHILQFIADDIESDQTAREQEKKSQGITTGEAKATSASEIHGSIRHSDGFDIVQMVAEFRALRASIIKLWTKERKTLEEEDLNDLTRFNESIDQSLAESVVTFTQKTDYSRDLLLGIIGHDIRSPLGAITMAAHLLSRVGPLNEKQTMLCGQIESSGERITSIVSNLLDLTRARVGAGLPVIRQKLDMKVLAEQVVDEIRLQNPQTHLTLNAHGDTMGEWDGARMGQVVSNLLSNAVQYGTKDVPITITITGTPDKTTLMVNNRGSSIPSSQIPTLFDSFTRDVHRPQKVNTMPNLGLGLFITKEIVKSHSGTVDVVSNDAEGTTFIVTLPRVS